MHAAMRAAAVAAALSVLSALAVGQTRQGDVTLSPASSVRLERLATLEFPWGMALLPDGRLLITEKPGRLRIFADGKLSAPIENVPKVAYRPTPGEQGGLLDVAVDPRVRAESPYLSLVLRGGAAAVAAGRHGRSALRRVPRSHGQPADGRCRDARHARRQPARGCAGDLAAGAEDDRSRALRPPDRLRTRRNAVHHVRRPHALRSGAELSVQPRQGRSHQPRRDDPEGQPVRRQARCARRHLEPRPSQHPLGRRPPRDRPVVGR